MGSIAKTAALVTIAVAAWIMALHSRAAPTKTVIVVEREATLPQRIVRVGTAEIVYQGTPIARVPVCPDSPCFKIDALFEQLEGAPPGTPPGAFAPERLVLVELDPSTDGTTERQVLNTIVAAGFWPVVTYVDDAVAVMPMRGSLRVVPGSVRRAAPPSRPHRGDG